MDSRAYVGARARNELDTIKQKASSKNLKFDDSPNFQIQVANGQLEKLLARATLKFEIGDNMYAEHFVVVMKITRPIMGLHFTREHSVVIDRTHGVIQLSHLTMQVKTASREINAKPEPVLTDGALKMPPETTKQSGALSNTLQNETQQLL